MVQETSFFYVYKTVVKVKQWGAMADVSSRTYSLVVYNCFQLKAYQKLKFQAFLCLIPYIACGLTQFLQEVILQASENSLEFFPCRIELQCCECCTRPPLANTEALPALALLSLLHLSEIQISILYGGSSDTTL